MRARKSVIDLGWLAKEAYLALTDTEWAHRPVRVDYQSSFMTVRSTDDDVSAVPVCLDITDYGYRFMWGVERTVRPKWHAFVRSRLARVTRDAVS